MPKLTHITQWPVIRASDGGIPICSALITVIVDVIDVNDNALTFTGTPYVAVQEENSPVPIEYCHCRHCW